MRPDEAHEGGEWAKRLLRAQMTMKGVSYRDLEERLRATGIEESEVNLRNKINRGMFTAAFFLQCLDAMGVNSFTFPRWTEFRTEYRAQVERALNQTVQVAPPERVGWAEDDNDYNIHPKFRRRVGTRAARKFAQAKNTGEG